MAGHVMDYTVDSPKPWQKKISISIPSDRLDEAHRSVAGQFARKSRLPGFRPGKAPLPMVEKAYRAEIREQVLETLIIKGVEDAVTALGLSPLAPPRVEGVREEEGLAFTALVEVKPEVTVGNYRGIKATVPSVTTTDAEIDEVVANLRERHAELRDPSAPRPCGNGDVVVIDLAGTIEGRPIPDRPLAGYDLELGRGELPPEIERGILGMSAGEEKTYEVEFPAGEPNSQVAGKTATFTVTVTALKEKVLPDLTDDFARGIGDYEGLAALKGKIREQILADGREMNRVRTRRAVVDRLLEENVFEVPPTPVERHITNYIDEGIRSMGQRGMETGHLRHDDPNLRDQFRIRATRDVRRELILEAIASAEGIVVTPEELDAEIASIAGRLNQPAEEVHRRLIAMGSLATIEEHVRDEKTLRFLEGVAEVKEVDREEYEKTHRETTPKGDQP
jgi:trigger factor